MSFADGKINLPDFGVEGGGVLLGYECEASTIREPGHSAHKPPGASSDEPLLSAIRRDDLKLLATSSVPDSGGDDLAAWRPRRGPERKTTLSFSDSDLPPIPSLGSSAQ